MAIDMSRMVMVRGRMEREHFHCFSEVLIFLTNFYDLKVESAVITMRGSHCVTAFTNPRDN